MSLHRSAMIVRALFLLTLSISLGACAVMKGPTPEPTLVPTAVATPQVNPTTVSAPTLTPESPTVTPWPTAQVVEVEPTMTPGPVAAGQTTVRDLPLGQAGNYVNVTFGYQLQYPPDWYTGFGNRPLLVSFSNLDPGAHNRLSMRAEGCLMEIRASTNVYGLTLQDMGAQLPQAFRNAGEFELGGERALRVRQSSEENPFDTEVVYVDHQDHLFVLTFEYARGAAETCRPAWEKLLDSWQWFEPEFAVYRNPTYGYAVSHPRRWYRFNLQDRGVSISSQDPTGVTEVIPFLVQGAMLVQTEVFDNPDLLPLKEWLAGEEWQADLSNDIPFGGLVGVRVVREGPTPEVQEMRGYFQGPLGKIYEVTCLYPASQQWEFRPIANAILYSFSF